MFPGFMQAIILTVIVILAQTTKHVHCSDDASDGSESYVISLTEETFDDAVSNNKFLLVKFVAPWCGHCKHLLPVYEAAAKQLAESGSEIKLASVDATVEKDLAQKYEVRSYPTIKFFIEGEVIDYTGGRTENEIVNWLTKRTGPPAEELTTVADLEKFKEFHDVAIVGVFLNTDDESTSAYVQVAKTVDNVPFAITSSKDIIKELNIDQNTIVLFKKFDEGRNDLTSTTDVAEIRTFIQVNQLPFVTEFNTHTAQKIFAGEIKIHILLFSSPQSDDHEQLLQGFEQTAKTFRGKTIFVSVDPDDAENKRVMEYFGLQASDAPTVRLVTLNEQAKKYKPESSELTASALTKFVNDFFDGQLKPALRSQEIPEDWNTNPVTVLVGKNFYDVVNDKTKTVLVIFIAPWCGHCKKLTPIYEELGEKYKDNENVIIAKIDATANEIENINVKSYPTIKLFPKDSDEILDFSGTRTVEGFSRFIDSNGLDSGVVEEKPVAEEPKEQGEEEQAEDLEHEDL